MQTLTPEIPTATSKPPDPEEDREPLFQAHGLTKVYPSGDVEVRALNGVDLELFEGELVVLLGASGSGKSTLLNILGGLDVPTEGTHLPRRRSCKRRRKGAHAIPA
jgi:putative ABC transport system ATP-binding protein